MSATDTFRALHRPGQPLLLPNPWDVGSARALASLGFEALATTSSGFAATLGRLDGGVSRDEALAHARAIVTATGLPVSADLENGFGDLPGDVAATVHGAVGVGLAGCSIEGYTGHDEAPIYPLAQAVERVEAAAATARGRLVVTARAENHLYGRPDLADTIDRLQRYQQAGADVLYAPGLVDADEIRSVVSAVDRPVNVLLLPGGPTVAQLAELGVARVSLGGALAMAALGALARAAASVRVGESDFWAQVAEGRALAGRAFGPG